MTSGTCESCGSENETVVSVHRVYLTPGEADAEPTALVVETTELWCSVCLDHYPHQPL